MGDHSEYRLLSISIKKPPKYGSVLSKDSTQRKNYIIHNVQKDETLQGIALKYSVSMEKIKRANNLWTSDSLFLRPTLSIPIDKPNVEEGCSNENGVGFLNGSHHNSDNKSLNSSSSSTYVNGNLITNSNSFSVISSTSTNNEHNNNLDYKISLNEIQSDLQSDQPSTSGHQANGNLINKLNASNEMLSRDESMDDFLSRIDQYIKQSKVKMNSFANSSEIISSQSDDDLFKLHNSKSIHSYRQHSLRNNDIFLNEVREGKRHHNHGEITYSLRKLEKEQEEREKFEL